jgi:hypothetical protein
MEMAHPFACKNNFPFVCPCHHQCQPLANAGCLILVGLSVSAAFNASLDESHDRKKNVGHSRGIKSGLGQLGLVSVLTSSKVQKAANL